MHTNMLLSSCAYLAHVSHAWSWGSGSSRFVIHEFIGFFPLWCGAGTGLFLCWLQPNKNFRILSGCKMCMLSIFLFPDSLDSVCIREVLCSSWLAQTMQEHLSNLFSLRAGSCLGYIYVREATHKWRSRKGLGRGGRGLGRAGSLFAQPHPPHSLPSPLCHSRVTSRAYNPNESLLAKNFI